MDMEQEMSRLQDIELRYNTLLKSFADTTTARFDLLTSDNFKYCVMFLKNGGERLRAIRLVMDAANMHPHKARLWVEELSFKPFRDERRKEQERLRHMEHHSTDIYG